MEMELRYYGIHNFTGRPGIGYEAPVAVLSTKAAFALKKVQKELNNKGLSLKIFDSYRPQNAVTSFKTWAKDLNDAIAKQEFYPEIDKKNLFSLGYIASKSGHTRGSTIDLTLVNLVTKEEIDMGNPSISSGPFRITILLLLHWNKSKIGNCYELRWLNMVLKNMPKNGGTTP